MSTTPTTLADVQATIDGARSIRDKLAQALKDATEMRDQWQATIDALNEQIGTKRRKPGRPRGSKAKKPAEAAA